MLRKQQHVIKGGLGASGAQRSRDLGRISSPLTQAGGGVQSISAAGTLICCSGGPQGTPPPPPPTPSFQRSGDQTRCAAQSYHGNRALCTLRACNSGCGGEVGVVQRRRGGGGATESLTRRHQLDRWVGKLQFRLALQQAKLVLM